MILFPRGIDDWLLCQLVFNCSFLASTAFHQGHIHTPWLTQISNWYLALCKRRWQTSGIRSSEIHCPARWWCEKALWTNDHCPGSFWWPDGNKWLGTENVGFRENKTKDQVLPASSNIGRKTTITKNSHLVLAVVPRQQCTQKRAATTPLSSHHHHRHFVWFLPVAFSSALA